MKTSEREPLTLEEKSEWNGLFEAKAASLSTLKDDLLKRIARGEAKPLRALRLTDVLLKTGHGKTAWYAAVSSGRAPQPIKIGSRATAWLESELDDYLARLAAERGTKR